MPRSPARSIPLHGPLLLLLASGCATVGHLQTADTVGKGNFEFAAEPSWYQRSLGVEEDVVVPAADGSKKAIIEAEGLNDGLGLEQGVFNLSGSLRYGLAETVDVGLRWGANGLDVLGKIQVTPADREDIVVSFVPSMGGVVVPTEQGNLGMLNLQLGALIGMGTGGGHQIVFGPKVQSWQAMGRADDVDLSGSGLEAGTADDVRVTASYVAVGGSAGFAIRVSPKIRVLPELALASPLGWRLHAKVGEDVFQTSLRPEGQALLMQAGVAVLLGQ